MDSLVDFEKLGNLVEVDDLDLARAIERRNFQLSKHLYGKGIFWGIFGASYYRYQAKKEAENHVRSLHEVLNDGEIKYLTLQVSKKLEAEERSFQREQHRVDIAHQLQLSAEALVAISKILTIPPFNDLDADEIEGLLNSLYKKALDAIFDVGAFSPKSILTDALEIHGQIAKDKREDYED